MVSTPGILSLWCTLVTYTFNFLINGLKKTTDNRTDYLLEKILKVRLKGVPLSICTRVVGTQLTSLLLFYNRHSRRQSGTETLNETCVRKNVTSNNHTIPSLPNQQLIVPSLRRFLQFTENAETIRQSVKGEDTTGQGKKLLSFHIV